MRTFIAAACGAAAVFLLMRNRPNAPQEVTQGSEKVKLPRRPSFSSAWKKDFGAPGNQFNGGTYGWRGLPANAYIFDPAQKVSDKDGLPIQLGPPDNTPPIPL